LKVFEATATAQFVLSL